MQRESKVNYIKYSLLNIFLAKLNEPSSRFYEEDKIS